MNAANRDVASDAKKNAGGMLCKMRASCYGGGGYAGCVMVSVRHYVLMLYRIQVYRRRGHNGRRRARGARSGARRQARAARSACRVRANARVPSAHANEGAKSRRRSSRCSGGDVRSPLPPHNDHWVVGGPRLSPLPSSKAACLSPGSAGPPPARRAAREKAVSWRGRWPAAVCSGKVGRKRQRPSSHPDRTRGGVMAV